MCTLLFEIACVHSCSSWHVCIAIIADVCIDVLAGIYVHSWLYIWLL